MKRRSSNPTPRLFGSEPLIEITQQEILQDLFWPTPPPGQWLDEGLTTGLEPAAAGTTTRSSTN